MDNLRLSAVADRVVAWHNRHPLARRISAAQVHAIGYVALPFAAEAPPPAAPSAAVAAAQAIAAAAATPLPVLTEVAQAAAAADGADSTPNPAEGSRLRERALARAREMAADPHGLHAADNAAALLATLAPATLKRDFTERFIDTLSPRQVARFALKHGRVLARAPHDGPVREVHADGAHRGRVPAQVYLLTAVIETDTRKSRVLLGLGPQVLGRRIHSSSRCMALAALAAGAVGTPLWLMRPHAAAPASAGAAASTATAESSGHGAGAAPAPGPQPAPGRVPGQAAEPGPAPADAGPSADGPARANAGAQEGSPAAGHTPAAKLAAAPSGPARPSVPMIEPPAAPPPETSAEATARRRAVSIVPLLSAEQKALAREQRQALMAAAAAAPAPARAPAPAAEPLAPAAGATAPVAAENAPPRANTAAAPAPTPAPTSTPTPGPARPATAAAPAGPVFAVSTRALRTRAEADQVRVAVQALLQTLGHDQVQVDVLPQGDDWRVVALPFPRRADADKARALLASRGMRVAVVDF